MSLDNDDSIFEQALRGDLPSANQQERLQKRLFAAAAGSGLAATSAASVQAGWGATVAAKVAALSWPVTLVLGAAVAAPVVALPIWLSPSHANHAAPAAVLPAAAPAGRVEGEAAPVVEPDRPSAVAVDPAESAPRSALRASSTAVVPAVRAQEASAVGTAALPAVAAFAAPSSSDRDHTPAASTLAAETQLLDRAFSELAAGHRAGAAALIAEHERRFPDGLLSQERERARARLEQNSKGE